MECCIIRNCFKVSCIVLNLFLKCSFNIQRLDPKFFMVFYF
uniref:Uncharacterized protein n=1 Tax=Pleurostomum flabellatum TaxID=405751 RepID=A0A7T0Q5X2_9EUKA|nr:hypothetical protein J6731_mgp50 [Pleurostomum flabellatum]QPL15641.1 hypothetical protein [Pleurostomum flabellatum]